MEKSWFLVFLISLIISNHAVADIYHVEVNTRRGPRLYEVTAPTDAMALDSVYVAAIYSKFRATPITARVIETGLSTQDLPYRIFKVRTEDGVYDLIIHTNDPKYIMTAIQATKLLFSKTTALEITYKNGFMRLSDLRKQEYILKFGTEKSSYKLNTANVDQGLIIMDLVARISKKSFEYQGIEIPHESCQRMFAN